MEHISPSQESSDNNKKPSNKTLDMIAERKRKLAERQKLTTQRYHEGPMGEASSMGPGKPKSLADDPVALARFEKIRQAAIKEAGDRAKAA